MDDEEIEKALAADDEALKHAFTAVGEFFYHFAALERSIDQVVAQLVGVRPDNIDVLSANLNFFAKVHILRATSKVQAGANLDRPFADTVNDIAKLNDTRNLFAHHQFDAVPRGVRFTALYKHALKGKAEQFTFDELGSIYQRIQKCDWEVRDYSSALRGQSFNDLVAALSRQPRARSAIAAMFAPARPFDVPD